MNEQRIKGAVDQAVGSLKRQFGSMTGRKRTQMEGTAQQVKGKIETAVGKLKDHLQTPPESNV